MQHVQDRFGADERRSPAALRFHRSSQRYRATRGDQAPLRLRLREIAAVRVRYGYGRIHILLRREGWAVNRKQVCRLYRLEGVSLRRRRPQRLVSAARRKERGVAARPNQRWSMDFVSDALFDGRRICALTLVDNLTREALAIVMDGGIRGEHMAEAVEAVAADRGALDVMRVDNGPLLVSKALDSWAYERGVPLDFSRPGKPTDNGFAESFNGRLREECLDTH